MVVIRSQSHELEAAARNIKNIAATVVYPVNPMDKDDEAIYMTYPRAYP